MPPFLEEFLTEANLTPAQMAQVIFTLVVWAIVYGVYKAAKITTRLIRGTPEARALAKMLANQPPVYSATTQTMLALVNPADLKDWKYSPADPKRASKWIYQGTKDEKRIDVSWNSNKGTWGISVNAIDEMTFVPDNELEVVTEAAGRIIAALARQAHETRLGINRAATGSVAPAGVPQTGSSSLLIPAGEVKSVVGPSPSSL